MEEIKIDDKAIERLKRKIIIQENMNLKTRTMSDQQMVSWIKKKIEEEAQEMLANILSRAVKEQMITEELKASDPLLWVQKMNQAKESAEEFVLNEVVYR